MSVLVRSRGEWRIMSVLVQRRGNRRMSMAVLVGVRGIWRSRRWATARRGRHSLLRLRCTLRLLCGNGCRAMHIFSKVQVWNLRQPVVDVLDFPRVIYILSKVQVWNLRQPVADILDFTRQRGVVCQFETDRFAGPRLLILNGGRSMFPRWRPTQTRARRGSSLGVRCRTGATSIWHVAGEAVGHWLRDCLGGGRDITSVPATSNMLLLLLAQRLWHPWRSRGTRLLRHGHILLGQRLWRGSGVPVLSWKV